MLSFRMFLIFALAAGVFVLSACQEKQNAAQLNPKSYFFDVPEFIDGELANIRARRFEKTAVLNADTTKIILDSLKIADELAVFKQYNINKPSWYDKYDIQQLQNPSKTIFIAKDSTLKTRRLEVTFDQHRQPQQILLVNQNKNFAFETQQRLAYTVGEGYTVELRQKTALSDAVYSFVQVRFLY